MQVLPKPRPLARRLPFALVCALTLVLAGGASSGAATTTVVTLTFDNNTISQYTLGYAQALQPHGAGATFYVNSGTVGSSKNFISWAQLAVLAAAGNEIGGKTVDGKVNLKTTTDLQTKIDEVCNDRQALIQHGFNPTSFAYPFAAFDATAEGIVRNCGYGNARAGGGISPTGALYAETRPPKDYFATRPYGPSGQVTLANLEAAVTGAAAHGGGWDQVVIQKICSQAQDPTNYATCTTSSGWIELADLNSFLDWIQAAGQANGAPAGTTIQTTAATMQSMDTVLPTTTIACNGSPCASSTYNGTVMVSMAPTDAGSGVASTHYTLDGTDPTLSSPSYTGQFPLTSSATVKFRSWDNAGNVEATHTQSVQLTQSSDSVAPTTTIACNGSPCAPSYTAPVTVTLNAADNAGGWGVAKTYYTTDGSTPTTSSPVYTGSFTIHGPTTVNFFSTDLAGNTEVVNSQSVQISTVVTLGFDDAYQNQWRYAVPLLRSHNMNVTWYPITSDSDVPFDCCMSWAQLATLQNQGDDVGSHTIDHPDLTTLTPDQITQEVCGSRQDMIANGIHDPVSFAYPFGTFNATVENIVKQCGFTNARQGGGVSTSNTTPTAPYIETLPAKDPMAVRTIAVDGASPMTLTDLEAFVNAAASHGGGWLPMTFHDVCDQAAPDYSTCMSSYGPIDDAVLGQFLDWLQAAGQPNGAPLGVTVKTMAQIMPGGTPPPAPAITDQPPTVSNSTTATFSFTDSQPGVTFQCTVDRVSSTCTSPFTSGVLADGSHTFTVWALDPAGNVSSGTSYTWTSDTTAPPPPTFTGTHSAKLVTIVLENESHPAIVGNPNAPYLNQLIANGEEFTNYYAVDTTGSFPNYLAMTSGNSSATAFSPNIFQAIDATGGALTWKEFMESMQGNCGQGTSGTVPGTTNTLYTGDHDPGLLYSPNISCAANDVPMNASTFDPSHLPDFSYVVPNECDDMHTFPTNGQACPAFFGPNTGTDIINMSDNWLAHVVPTLLAQPNVTVLITWDEGVEGQGEHITTLLAGAGVTPGSTDNTLYDHYSLEAGLYKYFGLGVAPGLGATATPLPIPGVGGGVPNNPSNVTQPSFAFTDPEASTSYQCRIDNAPFAACTSPYQAPTLSDGSHTFSVRAVDSAGNLGAASSYTWTVNTTPSAAPTIDTKPSDPSNNAQPSLSFSDSDSTVNFQCSIDGGGFSACTSPFTTGPLTDASHTFAVRSVNSLGNISAPTTYTWTVDTSPPPAPSLTGTPPATDTSTSASFSFGDDETGVTFECQLDGAAFASCTSPAAYSGLADGSHTFAVRARDAAGNASSATSYTWSLQAPRPPAPSIDTKPSNPSNASTSAFAFSDSDGTVSFQCSMDGAAYGPCTSPFTTAALADGSHTFAVEAVSITNRVSDPTQYTWTIDTVAPPAPSLTGTPPATDTSTSASFSFGDDETGVTFECQLDGAAFASCTSPAAYSGLADGSHTFAVRARDAAGNASSATSYTWSLQAPRPPAPSIDTKPSNPSNASTSAFAFSDSDGTVSFQCSMDGAAYGPCTSPFTTAALADGSHTFAVEAVDASNRTSNPAQYTWTIDTVAPPAPSITSKPAAVVASGSASFGFNDTEAGVAFECQLDGAAFASCTSPAAYSGLATGQHTFAVRARDAAGNASAATSYGWRIDITPPAQPTGLTASLTSQAVNLTWIANTETDLAGYNVYRGASATGPFTKLNTALLTTPRYSDTTAPAVTTSFYQVQAVDQLGNASTPAQLSVKRGIAFRSATSAQVTLGTSITLAKPSGTASSDVLVAALDIAGTTTVTAPSGWTLVRSTSSGSSLTQATYVHVAGTSEPSSYQWRFSSQRTASAVLAAYIGVNTTTPVDVSSGGSSSNSSSDVAPSVTTTVAGDLLIGVFGEAANATVTPPAGMLEQLEQAAGTSTTRVLSELSDQQLGAAGATGTRTATLSKSGANVGQLIALRPSQ